MSEEQNTRLVHDLYTAFGAGNTDAIKAALATDVDWDIPGDLPWSGRFRGQAEVLGYLNSLSQHLDTQEFSIEKTVAQGDTVVVLGTERHAVKTTGKLFESPWAHIFTIRNNRICKFREINDHAPAIEACRAG